MTTLETLRTDKQWSKLYLAVDVPATVFICRVNKATFTTLDNVVQITYDLNGITPIGLYTDVLPGMTCYVGTTGTGTGLYDLGMVRIRKSPIEFTLYIGRTSEIAWVDNLILTVVDDFGLWAKHLRQVGGTFYMDWDIAYADQHSALNPVVLMGPDAVLWLTGETVNFTPTAAASWVLGSTIGSSSYSWGISPSATATVASGGTTATPTITISAAGIYRVSCTIIAANGKISTGYRKIFVYSAASMPATTFAIRNVAGDWQTGGWAFEVEMPTGATLTTIRDRTKIILFAKDYYGETETEIGPITGYENIICAGWIIGESIDWNAEQSKVTFKVEGPATWIDNMTGFPPGVEYMTSLIMEAWSSMPTLTLDKGLFHLLYWRSTVCDVMDVTLIGNTDKAGAVEAPVGSLWQQLTNIAEGRILAHPCCDRYGRLFVQIDTQYLADNSSVPVTMAITKADWGDSVNPERNPFPQTSVLDLSGMYYDGSVYTPYFSKSPGNTFKRLGKPQRIENLILHNQTDTNTLAGLVCGFQNNDYPHVTIPLAANNRLIDICPRQLVTMTMAAGDTPRGIVWTDKQLIPRRVEFEYDETSGQITTNLDCEGVATPELSVTYIPPTNAIINNPNNNPPTFGPPGGIWFPPTIWFPPVINNPNGPDGPGGLDQNAVCKSANPGSINGPYGLVFSPSVVEQGEVAYAYFPCWIRQDNSYGKTSVVIYAKFDGDSQTHFTVVAIDSGQNPVQSPTSKVDTEDYTSFTFAPAGGLDVAGFKLSVEAGGATAYIKGSQIGMGTRVGNVSTWILALSGLTPGDYICTEAFGSYNAGPYPAYGVIISTDGINEVNYLFAEFPYPVIYPHTKRKFYQVSANGNIYVHVDDNYFGDNDAGVITFYVFSATVESTRKIYLSHAIISNICAS